MAVVSSADSPPVSEQDADDDHGDEQQRRRQQRGAAGRGGVRGGRRMGEDGRHARANLPTQPGANERSRLHAGYCRAHVTDSTGSSSPSPSSWRSMGFAAGLHRRRAVARRLRRRRVRSARASGPRCSPTGAHSPYAPLFALLGGARRRDAALAAGCRRSGSRCARGCAPGPGRRRRRARRGAERGARARDRLAGRRGRRCRPRARAACAATSSARSILQRLNDVLPPSGPLLNALARFDPFPQLDGPSADVAAAARRDRARPAGPRRGARRSCASWARPAASASRARAGSRGAGIVVTNAHVVAGQDDTIVQVRGDGPRTSTRRVVALRPAQRRRGAARRRPRRAARWRSPATPRSGTPARSSASRSTARTTSAPARLGHDADRARPQDAYGRGPVRAPVTTFRGRVRPGNSGGPLVDGDGASSRRSSPRRCGGRPGGYGVPNALVRAALSGPRRSLRVTGPCTR